MDNSSQDKSIVAKIKMFFTNLVQRFKKGENQALNNAGESTKLSQNWKLILVSSVLVVLFAIFTTTIVFAVGMYRYGWQGGATRTMMKILPYPAAIVGLDSVTMNEFYQEYSYVKHFYEKTGQTAPDDQVLKKQILDQLIERNILKHQARKYNVSVSGTEVDEEFASIANENGGEEEVTKVLDELYGLSVDGFKNLIRAQLLQEKLRDEVPLQYKAKHILIKWTSKDGSAAKKAARAKIKRIEKAIKDGTTSFEKMAKKYSQDTATKDKGGDLGWVQRGQMVEEFEEALFKLKKDEVSSPVLSKFGYHLIKVDDIKGKVDKSFADWTEEVINNTKKWILI